MYADVIFPLHLGALTYKIPEHLNPDILGAIVSAPLKGRDSYGLVVAVKDGCQIGDNIKHIQRVCLHYGDSTLISFLHWMADYYISTPGMALKCSLFETVIELLKKRGKGTKDPTEVPEGQDSISKISASVHLENRPMLSKKTTTSAITEHLLQGDSMIVEMLSNISEGGFKTILLEATNETQEQDVVVEIVRVNSMDKMGIIVLVPEIAYVSGLYGRLHYLLGSRLGVFHSRLKARDKRRFIEEVLKGQIDVVIGTRSAIFTPIKSPSLIVVLSEHNQSYKAEEGLRYNARDLAVMLGYMNKCPVVLSSMSPSLESIYNARTGRYVHHILSGGYRCKIRPVLHPFKRQLRSALSKEVMLEAKRVVDRGGVFLFLAQREGYSLIYCTDCGTLSKCADCGNRVVYHQDSKRLTCNHCGREGNTDISCNNCKGFNLRALGGGAQRIKEEIELFLNTQARIVTNATNFSDSLESVIIGKRANLAERQVDGAAMIDFDYLLHRYGFRANEKALQEVLRAASLVKAKGTFLIQTNNTASQITKSLRANDLKAFYDYELAMRRTACYPPYKRLASIELYVKNETTSGALSNLIGRPSDDVQLLGPVPIQRLKRGYAMAFRCLLKSSNKRSLGATIKAIQDRLLQTKAIEMVIDVDPLVA